MRYFSDAVLTDLRHIAMEAFPSFVFTESAAAFIHWAKSARTICEERCQSNTCLLCYIFETNVRHATLLLLEGLYSYCSSVTAGSDVVSIHVGRFSQSWAKATMSMKKRSETHKQILSADFPGLSVDVLKNLYVYTPLLANGGNALYTMLKRLYANALNVCNERVSRISLIDFVLLCFHLSKQYYITADEAYFMWSEALRLNSVVTLFTESEVEHTVFASLFI